jgi:hypothetical protein
MRKPLKNLCKCGKIKLEKSKKCKECFTKGKHKQLSRMRDKGYKNLKIKWNLEL